MSFYAPHTLLASPTRAGIFNRLVDNNGGLIVYDGGCAGRELGILAAAEIARRNGEELLVVEPKALHFLFREDLLVDYPDTQIISPQMASKVSSKRSPQIKYTFSVNLWTIPHKETKMFKALVALYQGCEHFVITGRPNAHKGMSRNAHDHYLFFQARKPISRTQDIHHLTTHELVKEYEDANAT